MFGRNETVKPRYDSGDSLRVKEIFRTIQGEGPRVGEAAVFVRLAGCNLKCWFCDTDFEQGPAIPVAEIIATIKRVMTPAIGLIVITGGEPMAQEIGPLCEAIDYIGCYAQIETAGTCWPENPVFSRLIKEGLAEIVCSPKTPRVHSDVQNTAVAWKYIVRAGELSEEDGLPIKSTQLKDSSAHLFRPSNWNEAGIFLQPMMEYDEAGKEDLEKTRANTAAAAAACIRFGYRLSVQVHKVVGLP